MSQGSYWHDLANEYAASAAEGTAELRPPKVAPRYRTQTPEKKRLPTLSAEKATEIRRFMLDHPEVDPQDVVTRYRDKWKAHQGAVQRIVNPFAQGNKRYRTLREQSGQAGEGHVGAARRFLAETVNWEGTKDVLRSSLKAATGLGPGSSMPGASTMETFGQIASAPAEVLLGGAALDRAIAFTAVKVGERVAPALIRTPGAARAATQAMEAATATREALSGSRVGRTALHAAEIASPRGVGTSAIAAQRTATTAEPIVKGIEPWRKGVDRYFIQRRAQGKGKIDTLLRDRQSRLRSEGKRLEQEGEKLSASGKAFADLHSNMEAWLESGDIESYNAHVEEHNATLKALQENGKSYDARAAAHITKAKRLGNVTALRAEDASTVQRFVRDLPQELALLTGGIVGFKANLMLSAVKGDEKAVGEMAKGFTRPFYSPQESFRENPAGAVVMWALVGGGAGWRAFKSVRARVPDPAGRAALDSFESRAEGYQDLPPEERAERVASDWERINDAEALARRRQAILRYEREEAAPPEPGTPEYQAQLNEAEQNFQEFTKATRPVEKEAARKRTQQAVDDALAEREAAYHRLREQREAAQAGPGEAERQLRVLSADINRLDYFQRELEVRKAAGIEEPAAGAPDWESIVAREREAQRQKQAPAAEEPVTPRDMALSDENRARLEAVRAQGGPELARQIERIQNSRHLTDASKQERLDILQPRDEITGEPLPVAGITPQEPARPVQEPRIEPETPAEVVPEAEGAERPSEGRTEPRSAQVAGERAPETPAEEADVDASRRELAETPEVSRAPAERAEVAPETQAMAKKLEAWFRSGEFDEPSLSAMIDSIGSQYPTSLVNRAGAILEGNPHNLPALYIRQRLNTWEHGREGDIRRFVREVKERESLPEDFTDWKGLEESIKVLQEAAIKHARGTTRVGPQGQVSRESVTLPEDSLTSEEFSALPTEQKGDYAYQSETGRWVRKGEEPRAKSVPLSEQETDAINVAMYDYQNALRRVEREYRSRRKEQPRAEDVGIDDTDRWHEEQRLSVFTQYQAQLKATGVAQPREAGPREEVSGETTPAAKEPWEMTREEFGKQSELEFTLPANMGPTVRPMKGRVAPETQFFPTGKPPEPVLHWAHTEIPHRTLVDSALREGKPVPASVLAEYPDLAAKYEKAPPLPQEQAPPVTPAAEGRTGQEGGVEAARERTLRGLQERLVRKPDALRDAKSGDVFMQWGGDNHLGVYRVRKVNAKSVSVEFMDDDGGFSSTGRLPFTTQTSGVGTGRVDVIPRGGAVLSPEEVTAVVERLSRKPSPEAVPSGESAPAIAPGDTITDGLVQARVIGEGTVRFGREDLPAYRVEVLTGHERGNETLILKEQARKVAEGEAEMEAEAAAESSEVAARAGEDQAGATAREEGALLEEDAQRAVAERVALAEKVVELKPTTAYKTGWEGNHASATSPLLSNNVSMLRADALSPNARERLSRESRGVRRVRIEDARRVWRQAITDADMDMELLGLLPMASPEELPRKSFAILASKSGNTAVVADADIFNLARSQTKGDRFRVFSSDPLRPIVLYKGRKPVALVMPYNADVPMDVPRARARMQAGYPQTGGTGQTAAREAVTPPEPPTEAVEKGPAQALTLPRAQTRRARVPQELIPRPSEIVKSLERAIAPIRTGRFLGRAGGIFKVRERVMRTRIANRLPIIAHEVGHAVKPLIGDVQGFAEELKLLAYPGAKNALNEGYAEFVRYWLTDPATAKQKAPRFLRQFEQAIEEDPGIATALRKAQRDIVRWVEQPDEAKVLSTISTNQPSPKRERTIQRRYADWVDSLRPLYEAERQITEGAEVTPTKSAFAEAWRLRGIAGKSEAWLESGVTDAAGKPVGKSLRDIISPVADDLDGFRAYAVARHGLERIDALGERAMPLSRDVYEATVARGETKYQRVLSDLVDYQDALLDDLVDAGVLSAEAKAAMREKYPNHISLYRVMDEAGPAGAGKQVGRVPQPIKRARGSGRDIIDPIESLIRDTYVFHNVAQRARVLRNLTALAESAEGKGAWVEEIPTPGIPVKFSLGDVLGVGEGRAAERAGLDLDKVHNVFLPQIPGRANIVRVFHEGKARYYELHPELYSAVSGTDALSSNVLIQALQYPAAILRAGATLTPEFGLRNPVRDIWTALQYTKNGFTPVSFVRGLFHAVKRDALYDQWRASGGAHATLVSLDRSYLQESLRAMQRDSTSDAVIDLAKHPIQALRAFSEWTEAATRLGEFGEATRWGRETDPAKVLQAALDSRDVTLDFSRSGNVGKQVNRAAAFFNAQIQGVDKLAREFKAHPAQMGMRAVSYITLPSVLLYMANRNNPNYQNLQEWEKDLFWYVPRGGGKLIRIPKPFELGIVFGSLPERILRKIDKADPHAFDDFALNLLQTQFPSPLPTALGPWIGYIANRSFTGAPIVPRSQQDLPPELQIGPGTTGLAKFIGGKLDLSPRKIDALISGYTGGLGRYTAQATSFALETTGVIEKGPPQPQPVLGQRPIVRAFVPNELTSPVQVERFYRKYQELSERSKLAEAGKGEISDGDALLLTGMRMQANALSGARKISLAIYADKTMRPEQKTQALLSLKEIQKDIAVGDVDSATLTAFSRIMRAKGLPTVRQGPHGSFGAVPQTKKPGVK